ncbi:MAG: hypothetical protein NT172_01845, partial [Planctomycetota bacterium]|nr:hypothetical protein [Planctomycetota bacterium]
AKPPDRASPVRGQGLHLKTRALSARCPHRARTTNKPRQFEINKKNAKPPDRASPVRGQGQHLKTPNHYRPDAPIGLARPLCRAIYTLRDVN